MLRSFISRFLTLPLSLLTLMVFVACSNAPASAEAGGKKAAAKSGKMTAEKATALMKAGARIVDVRTLGEFSGGHLKGALHIPIAELGKRMKELEPKTKPVVLYCASGARSHAALKMLQRAGFKEVYDIKYQSGWPLK